jgi:predicted ATPase/DNA-binding SARP family transcriptional activator
MDAQFRILGPVEAVLDGRPVALGAPKQRALFALLLVNRRRVATAEQLVDGLWGEEPPASAQQSLQVYVHGLRRALGSERIETAGRGYRAAVTEDELDLDRFERLLERGRAALAADHPEDAADDLRQALALWRGLALADLPEEARQSAGADVLDELRLTALELRNDAELACGHHDAIVAELESLLAENPYRERFLEQRVLALYRCGRQADALEAYRNARRVLAEELGLEPSPALQELERAILRQEPALAAPAAPPRLAHTLPAPPTPLVGRRLEIATVGAFVRDEGARLVTLTGPGGTGKTRLALAVADALEQEFRDGALFVGLAAVSSPELLVPTIAEALDVREGDRQLAEGVKEHLRERRLLLVLDNLEQLLPAAPFIGELLAAAPRLAILATSRAPLRLAAEHDYPVPPFDTPAADLPFETLVQTDALRLFIARARAVNPAFELDEPSARDVARICRRLDGLPLAIELAAARSKLLAPGEILERLEREPHLLGSGPRDAPARQRTLAATIRWSYDLLSPDEQLAFARLGVFVGGCTLEAAEEVCDVPLETLATLVDNNLLRRRDGRVSMLETVRHFAAERLDEADGAEVRRRHAERLTELAEAMAERTTAGDDATSWLDRIQPEHDNVRAALAWAIEEDPELAARLASSLRLFWEVRGHFREGGRWIDEALARSDGVTREVRLRTLSASGAVAFRLSDYEKSRARFAAALEVARELDDELWIARLLSDLGTVAAVEEKYDEATVLLEESAALFRKLDIPARLATVLGNLGHIFVQRGDYDRAIEVTEEALSFEAQHKPNRAITLYNLGSSCLHAGQLERAREWLEQGVALTFELGYKEVMGYTLSAFVRLCLREGDPARAAHLAGVADGLLEDAGVQLQPTELALFDEAKEATREQLGDDEYARTHDGAMAEPLEEALRRGDVLAAATVERQ